MKDRIKTRRKELRMSQKRVGDLCDVSASAVSQWESGTSEPAESKLDLLAEALAVEREWLEFGPEGRPVRAVTGKPMTTEEGNDLLTTLIYHDSNQMGGGIRQRVTTIEVKPINVIGDVQAGVFKTAVEWPKSAQFQVKVPVEAPFDRIDTFGLRVLGPSMDQVFPSGTIIICAQIQDLGRLFEIQSGHYVVVKRRSAATDELEASVKQFIRDEQGVAWLWPRSNHPEFQTPVRVEDLSSSDDNDEVTVWALVVAEYRAHV